MDLPTHPLQSERYRGCSVTTLGSAALSEIGRVTVHYGLLVARVKEVCVVRFVSNAQTTTVSWFQGVDQTVAGGARDDRTRLLP